MCVSDFIISNGILTEYTGHGGVVTVPDEVWMIGEEAFRGCDGLISVTVPDSVRIIAHNAFYECRNLESAIISDSVRTIAPGAFAFCTFLDDVRLPESLSEIDRSVFAGCASLREIRIPENVTEIRFGAFSGCTGLSSVTLPKGLKSIGKLAFNQCPYLTIHAPAGSYAEKYAEKHFIEFIDSDSEDPSKYLTIGSILSECNDCGKRPAIPRHVEHIGPHAFKDCTELEELFLHYGITEIDVTAFEGCRNLTRIIMPDTVNIIADYLELNRHRFGGISESCDLKGLESEKINAFADCPDVTVIAPAGSYAENYAKLHGLRFSSDPES